MFSRLFLISTLLLFGITTVAIGAPVEETIESVKAVKIPQMMGSGNLTLNRRWINGVPGLPQCPNQDFPLLVSSNCADEKTIHSVCGSFSNDDTMENDSDCPEDTTCKDFKSEPDPDDPGETPAPFAMCIHNDFIETFANDQKAGLFCKNYHISVSDGRATVSINIYDVGQRPIPVRSIQITVNEQVGTRHDTPNFSRIVDVPGNEQDIRVCMEITVGVALIVAMFSYLDGTYGNSKSKK